MEGPCGLGRRALRTDTVGGVFPGELIIGHARVAGRVRRALLHAVDRQTIVETIYAGRTRPLEVWLHPTERSYDAVERYLVASIRNGTGSGPLEAHFYDLGPGRGLRLVGLERPED